MIRITKTFSFEMAHALYGHDGPCKNIHGHSYILSVTLKGKPISDKSNPKNGMVYDFADLKKIIQDKIISVYDHALVLQKDLYSEEFIKNIKTSEKVILKDFQPTCENLLIDFVKEIKNCFPKDIYLYCLKLQETKTSYAEWHAEDNLS